MDVNYLLKSYNGEKVTFSKLRFSKLKNSSLGQFLGSLDSLQLKN